MWNPCLGWEPRGGNHRHCSQAGLSSNLTLHEPLNIHLLHQQGGIQGWRDRLQPKTEFQPPGWTLPSSWTSLSLHISPAKH